MATTRSSLTGFTLLEVLLALSVASLVAFMVLPRMNRLLEGVELDGQRADLRIAVEGLGYRAYWSGVPIVLSSVPGRGSEAAPDWFPADLVAKGWKLTAVPPVHFAANGVCAGGRLTVTDPRGEREYFVLKAPHCLLEPAARAR